MSQPSRLERIAPGGLDGDALLWSALAADSPVMPLARFRAWFDGQRAFRSLNVRPVTFPELDQWDFTAAPRRLVHRSGKFFAVEGLRVTTDFGPTPMWDQPIIRQDEVGVLGILAHRFDGVPHFLMQVKIEPGNVNGVQLSPTVQSTRSNYTQVHGGRETPYNDYFVGPGAGRVLIDRLLVEQGARFLRKRNRNMIVEVDDEVEAQEGFCWLTLGQIKRLLRQDNLINMSARSVLSCIPFAAGEAAGMSAFGAEVAASFAAEREGLHGEDHLLNWLNGLRASYGMRLEQRPLDALSGWTADEASIRHESGRHFSVVAVAVEALGREVTRWSQPLLAHSGLGLSGLLMQRINGVQHVLARACLFPGNGHLFDLGPTVSRANATRHFGAPDQPPFLDYFRDPPPAWVRYRSLQSEEGGRFQRFVSDYVIVELPEDEPVSLPEGFKWMTLGQFSRFNAYGQLTIEGRNMLACFSFLD